MIIKYMHPSDRSIRDLKPDLVEGYAAAGYLPVPWDCVCERVCRCHLRPTAPTPEQLEEATAYRDLLTAGIAAAKKKKPE